MLPSLTAGYHPDEIQILPTATIILGRCDHCPKVHAIMFEVAWLFFSCGILIQF